MQFLLREHYSLWSEDKLVVLPRRRGQQVSTLMVGHIVSILKQRGVLKEPPRNGICERRRQHRGPYVIRKSREYRGTQPGDLIQVDTLDLCLLSGVVLK